MKDCPQDTDWLIYEALAQLGFKADARTIVSKVRRLQIGLPCEDEFSAICVWLGKCDLVHKLDQQQFPMKSRNEYQVPDLLALFTNNGQNALVLIEVKSNKGKTLSFTPDYLERLKNYSKLLKIPCLIAWKHSDIWVLFEIKHLKKATKNYNISFVNAIRENLLGVLAGDFSYKIGKGAGIHFLLRKDELLMEEKNGDKTVQEWRMIIDEVSFSDYMGKKRSDLDTQVISLFATWDLEEEQDSTDKFINMRFISSGDTILFAHMALVRLLKWEILNDEKIDWRRLLMKDNIINNIENFSLAINTAMEQKVVYNAFHQQPITMPDFLK